MSFRRKTNKTDDKMLVPWFNSAEWLHVYDLIYSNTGDKAQALYIIKLWKLRVPKLPSGIEGTLIVLDALLQDTNIISDENLCLLYGTSIMRFLNICGAYTDNKESFYKTAKKNKLPDWLIDLRNDIAHDQIVPSKYMLKLGLEFCLNWLKKTYWEEQKEIIRDYVVVSDENSTIKKLQTVTLLYCRLKDIQHFFPSADTVEKVAAIDEDLCKKLSTTCSFCTIGLKTNINYVCNAFLDVIQKGISKKKSPSIVSAVLESFVNDHTPVCFLELSEEKNIGQKYKKKRNQLSKASLKTWKNFIQMLYKENMIINLIKILFHYSCNLQKNRKSRMGASLWLLEIFEALEKTQDQNEERNNSPEGLDFQFFNPNVITELKSMQHEILSNPCEFSCIFVKRYLELCQYPEQFINDSISALENFTIIHKNVTQDSRLHSIEEFEEYMDEDADVLFEDFADSSKNKIINEYPSKWQLVKDVSIFQGCPLGVLSHQSRETNPLLLNV